MSNGGWLGAWEIGFVLVALVVPVVGLLASEARRAWRRWR